MVDLTEAGRRLSLAQMAPTPPLSKLEAMRARRARHRRTALAASAATVIVVAAGLAGWISSGAPRSTRVTTTPASLPSEPAAAVVRTAVAATKAAGTAQFYETVIPSQPGSSVASVGSVNFATNRWTMTTYQGTPGPSTETAEVRVIGPTTYERSFRSSLPGGGYSSWMKSNLKIGTFVWVFDPLSNPSLTASYAGSSNVQGTPTSVYDVYIPAGTVGGTPLAPYEIRVWLDDQGRIREATSTRPAGGTTGTTTQTLRMSQFGIPVTVAVPTPIQPGP
jgi:hypothetical protein